MIQINDKVLADTFSGFQIPPKPQILQQIDAIVNDPDPSVSALANCVASDVGVSSRILKVINSPFYGMNRAISDVRQAVFILGMEPIKALVTAMKLKTAFKGECCISLELFWDNAVEIANTMVFIGSRLQNKLPPEDLYTLGLFHDAGIPAMACKFSDYVEVLKQSNDDSEQTLPVFEEPKYNTNHAIVGYFLANSWHLPKNICQIILNHHEMDFLNFADNQDDVLKFCVLKLAEEIVFSRKRLRHIPEWSSGKDALLANLLLDDESLQDLVDDAAEIDFV